MYEKGTSQTLIMKTWLVKVRSFSFMCNQILGSMSDETRFNSKFSGVDFVLRPLCKNSEKNPRSSKKFNLNIWPKGNNVVKRSSLDILRSLDLN